MKCTDTFLRNVAFVTWDAFIAMYSTELFQNMSIDKVYNTDIFLSQIWLIPYEV